jgi:hypothetical protein
MIVFVEIIFIWESILPAFPRQARIYRRACLNVPLSAWFIPARHFIPDDAILVINIEFIDKRVEDCMTLDAVKFGKIIVVTKPLENGSFPQLTV